MNKLKKLRKIFKIYKLDGYIIPKNDEFFGEYVDERYDRLKYISSFSGSAGYAIILRSNSYLFVDGRYTLQAKKESGKNFKIIEIHKNKPSKILSKILIKIKIGFDPKLFSEANLIKNFKTKNVSLIPIEQNLIDKIWLNRPKTKIKKFFLLNSKHAGRNYENKLKTVCKILKKRKINKLLITAPENLAWLLNIRGKDSKYSPLPNCHAILDNKKKITLIVNKKKINSKFKQNFKNTINYVTPSHIIKYLDNLDPQKKFLIDKFSCSYFYKKLIEKKFLYDENNDPIYILKAKKNNVEISNSIKSHIVDGVALTKFIYWIKNNINKFKITEISAEKKFRKKSPNYQFPSFSTISGAGPNGAIVHYRASKKTNRLIKKNDIYLCDSGGQYHYGTTDVTRTLCFSQQSKKIKNIFTKVLKGHIGVVTYNFNKNTTGKHLDIVARDALKKSGLDYAHGTGHGVGYFLNVHEGPQAISKFNHIKLKQGMIISNEPGYYKANKFGIRIENLVYTKKRKNKLAFENLTLAPIEKDLINFKLLNNKEKKYLNEYHKKVYLTLNPYLNRSEKHWLKSISN
jgi:Xaa-Pro aminopeptidase